MSKLESKASGYEKVNILSRDLISQMHNRIDERIYDKQPKIVKNLRRDYMVVKTPIPDTYLPVSHVKKISSAGAADLKIQEFYHE